MTRDLSSRRRVRQNRRGAAAMEFAFVAPVLFTMLLGTVELGRYFFTQQNVRTLTAELARAALINPTGVTGCTTALTPVALSTAATAVINSKTPFLSASGLNVCITATTLGRRIVLVTTRYGFTTPVPFVSFLTGNIDDQTRLVYTTQ